MANISCLFKIISEKENKWMIPMYCFRVRGLLNKFWFDEQFLHDVLDQWQFVDYKLYQDFLP